jgi:hypothetical protein
MANRSYLYSTDSPPTSSSNPSVIRAVSQHNWSIPLAHHLLLGRSTQVVPSMIWEKTIGIAGDFAGGVELLTGFLRAVARGEVPEREEFDRCVETTVAHLERQRDHFFVLEAGEMFALLDEDPERSAHDLADHGIPHSVQLAEAAVDGAEDDWLASVRTSWRDHVGSWYSDVLYYSFGSSRA